MLRKLLVLSMITLGLYTAGLNVSNGIRANVLRAQIPPPGNSLDDAEFTVDLNIIQHPDIEGSQRTKWLREGVNYFFGRVIGLLASLIGAVAILMISYGGFLMITFSANEEMYRKGVDYIRYAVLGLVLGLSAYIMVTAVQLLVHSIYAG